MNHSPFRLYCIICFLFILISCGEEEILLPAPQVTIKSADEVAFGRFEISLEIDIGEKIEIKNIELILEDITIENSPIITKQIGFTDERIQDVKVSFDDAKVNHDYKAHAKIITGEYTYLSETYVIRASKNNFSLVVSEDPHFADYENNISDVVGKGDLINVVLYFQSDIQNKEIIFKLNNSINLEHNLVLSGEYSENNGRKELYGQVTIPMDVEPGIYDVSAYIDNVKITAETRINILKGSWSNSLAKLSGDERINCSWFLIDNELYVLGGELTPASSMGLSEVWRYSFERSEWTQLNDFPESFYYNNSFIKRIPISVNNRGYVIVQKDTETELWLYQKETDSWSLITQYPGEGMYDPIIFTINEKVYFGGGVANSNGAFNYSIDFWQFDLTTENWTQLNNLPEEMYPNRCTAVGNSNLAYVVEPISNRLWEYNPGSDLWQLKANFPGRRRGLTNLVIKDDNVFLLGGYNNENNGMTFNDCWEFSPEENSWELNSFLPKKSQSGIAFVRNEKLYYGMGYLNVWEFKYVSEIYELDSK